MSREEEEEEERKKYEQELEKYANDCEIERQKKSSSDNYKNYY